MDPLHSPPLPSCLSSSSSPSLESPVLSSSDCRISPDFRIIALANPPTFPFLGNDFYREMGDIFSCHVVSAPDADSELALLSAYADGKVPPKLLELLIAAFTELRGLVEKGQLLYPYSTRELVNVVRHLALYPGDSVGRALENVFAFDALDDQLRQRLFAVFKKYGIPLRDGHRRQGGKVVQPVDSLSRQRMRKGRIRKPVLANSDKRFEEQKVAGAEKRQDEEEEEEDGALVNLPAPLHFMTLSIANSSSPPSQFSVSLPLIPSLPSPRTSAHYFAHASLVEMHFLTALPHNDTSASSL